MKQEQPEIKLIEPSTLDPWPTREQLKEAVDVVVRQLGLPPHLLGIDPSPKQRKRERSRAGGTGLPGESVGGE